MATVPADLARHHWHPPTHQHPPPGCQRPGQQRSRSRRAVLAACFHTGMPAFARMVHARGLLARLSDASGIQAPVRTAWFRRHNMSQRTAPQLVHVFGATATNALACHSAPIEGSRRPQGPGAQCGAYGVCHHPAMGLSSAAPTRPNFQVSLPQTTLPTVLGRGPHKNCKNDLDDQT